MAYRTRVAILIGITLLASKLLLIADGAAGGSGNGGGSTKNTGSSTSSGTTSSGTTSSGTTSSGTTSSGTTSSGTTSSGTTSSGTTSSGTTSSGTTTSGTASTGSSSSSGTTTTGNGNTASNGNTKNNGNTAATGNTASNGNTQSSGNTAAAGNSAGSGNTASNGNTQSNGNTAAAGNTASSGNTQNNGNSAAAGNTASNGNSASNGNTQNNGNTASSGTPASPPSTSTSDFLSLPVNGCSPSACQNPSLGFYKGTFQQASKADAVQNMNYGEYIYGTRISSDLAKSSTDREVRSSSASPVSLPPSSPPPPSPSSSPPSPPPPRPPPPTSPDDDPPSSSPQRLGRLRLSPSLPVPSPSTTSSSSSSSTSSSSSSSSTTTTSPTVSVTSPPPPGVKGDPHFVGWDGVHFDFTGQPGHSYCMLSDNNVHVNMYLDGYTETSAKGVKETHSWIKGLGFITPNHKLALFAKTSASPARNGGYMKRIVLDGREFNLTEGTKYGTADGEIEIEFDEAGRKEGDEESDVYTVSVRDTLKILLRMRPEIGGVRRPEDSFIHFSMEILDEQLSTRTHGILGQTLYNLNNPEAAPSGYDVEYSGVVWAWQVVGADAENYIQGTPSDYVTSHLLTSDCRFSRFSRRGLFHSALSLGCWRKGFVC
ncbi:unnamed protein product [Closterium sp. NIES-54]